MRWFVPLIITGTLVGASVGASPQAHQVHGHRRVTTPKTAGAPSRTVAYDARDLRYYPLSWAKAHGMRDPAGDPLVPMAITKLPKGANPALVPASPTEGRNENVPGH